MSSQIPPRARRMAAPLTAVALLGLAGCGGQGGTAATGTGGASSSAEGGAASAAPVAAARVTIVNFAYKPAAVRVKAGGTVTWTNRDSAPHTATSDDGRTFDTGTLTRGQSRRVKLTKPGTYSYYCTFHRFMVARVVVE